MSSKPARIGQPRTDRKRERSRLYYESHREECKARSRRNWRKAVKRNPIKLMLRSVEKRAFYKRIDFNLTEDDIIVPAFCPVLGIPIKRSARNPDNRPSIDRIIPSHGYVRGNVIVVSVRANRIKNDSTVAELGMIYTFYKSLKLKVRKRFAPS